MSYSEFVDWQIYYNEEPFLADRIEIQLAKIGHSNMSTGMSKSKIEFDYFMVTGKNSKQKTEKEKNKELITAFKGM